MTEEEIQLLIEMDIEGWESYLTFLSAQIKQQVGLGAFAGLSRADILKEAKSRKPAHRQPVSKPCTPQEVKEFNLSSLKANKTKQENKTCPTANSERVQKPQPNRVESTQEEPLESIPNPIHQRATDELLGTIQGHIQPRSYEVWLKDIWVENETDTEVTLKTPKGFYVANYIKDNYLSKIESITGKQVRVLE